MPPRTKKLPDDYFKIITDKYDIEKFCDSCKPIEVVKMILNPKRQGFLICPRCGAEASILDMKGLTKLVDQDAGEPLVSFTSAKKKNSIEQQMEDELKALGYTNIRLSRL